MAILTAFGLAKGGFLGSLLSQRFAGKDPSVKEAATTAMFCAIDGVGAFIGASGAAGIAVDAAVGMSIMPFELLFSN